MYLLLDAIAVKVRMDRRVACVPVLVAMGVRESGDKVLLALQLMGQRIESGLDRRSWRISRPVA